MLRPVQTIWLCFAVALIGGGCANHMELRAIEGFASALAAEDLGKLKDSTSGGFEEKALRLDESVDDLKVLRLPTGKVEIVKIEDLSETEKIVTVEVGESKRKLRYVLVKGEKSRKWVVDDVYVKQKRDGVEATKSVTEQMDLLLSVREFFKAWNAGDRERTLDVATPKLRDSLDKLPPAYLAQVARDVVGDASSLSKIRPEAQLDDDVAIVKISRPKSQLLMTYELRDGHWRVSDLAVSGESDKEGIPSVMKHCIALTSAVDFLRAYNEEDKDALASLCTDKFFTGGLSPANLKEIPLPQGDSPRPEQQFHIIAQRAEMIIPTATELVKISLMRQEAADADSAVVYKVEDVTLYETDGSQEKRLSSMFTAKAMLGLFCEALSSRDLPMLRKASTADFNRRVWDRLKQSGRTGTVALAAAASHTTIDDLPLGEIPPEAPAILSTKYNGAVTEMEVRQGDVTLTYQLRERMGEVRVDDVFLPAPGRPRSLKETTELIVPLREFTAGLQLRDIGLIQRTSSNDYNRLVWKQTDRVPELTASALRHLRTTITGVESRPDQVLLTLGDESWGAKVVLVKEYSQLVVDDVLLVGGLEAQSRMKLKHAMRMELANGSRSTRGLDERTVMRPGGVVQAGYEEAADEGSPDVGRPRPAPLGARAPERVVEPAGHLRAVPLPGNSGDELQEPDDQELLPPAPREDAFDSPLSE